MLLTPREELIAAKEKYHLTYQQIAMELDLSSRTIIRFMKGESDMHPNNELALCYYLKRLRKEHEQNGL